MFRSRLLQIPAALASLALVAGCETSKSANPLSPSVAGPIPGVNITTPRLVEPAPGAQIEEERQPVTLVVENATTSGQRPLKYVFELATDVNFATVILRREGIEPGDGRTSLRLPDPLESERTYYWRAQALDGANTGPPSAPVHFRVYTPRIIEAPVVIEPAPGATLASPQPTFRVRNANRSGPVGPLAYRFEVATDPALTTLVAVEELDERPGETGFTLGRSLDFDRSYYWRVRAFDKETDGDWSPIHGFRTPAEPPPQPPPQPPPAPPPGGYPNNGPDVVRYVEARYPSYLVAGVSESQRVANMEFLRDRVIETALCGGMDVAWNLKRGVGPRSIDAVAWRTGGKVEVVDIGVAFDDTSRPLSLQWAIVGGPPGYDPYPMPACK